MVIYYCLFVVLMLPIILALGSIPFRIQQLSKVDFENPRSQAAQLKSAGERIVAAQKNAWEALIVFTVALFIAVSNGVLPESIATASMVFVAARLLHAFFYIIGQGVLRFLSFGLAMGSALWIIWVAIF